MIEKIAPYWKAVLATLGAISTWGITAAPDGIDQVELYGLLGILATLGATYRVRNADARPRDARGRFTTNT